MRRHALLRRLLACVLLPPCLANCTTWQAQELSPEQVIAQEQPNKVRVKLANGSSVVLEQPSLSGDTLRGQGPGNPFVPLGDVSAIEVRKTDALLTAGLAVGCVAAATALLLRPAPRPNP